MSLTSSSSMSLNVDIQAVFCRIGADILMFLTAMLAYFILHRIKTRAVPGKIAKKEASLPYDQECPIDCTTTSVEEGTKASSAVAKEEAPVECSNQVVEVELPKPAIVNKPSESQMVKPAQRQPTAEKEPFNVKTTFSLMKKHAATRNIKDTMQAFRLIEDSGEPLTTEMYNTVLRAWVNCGNIWAAENWMEEMKEAGQTDETSFSILVKALVMVRDLNKARAFLLEMEEKVSPCVTTFDELLLCFARAGLFNDGITVLKHMQRVGVEPTSSTLCAITKLVNSARAIHQRCSTLQELLGNYHFDPKGCAGTSPTIPCLISVASQAAKDSAVCIHEVEAKGNLVEIKALRVTLTQLGFLDKPGNYALGLDGLCDRQQDADHCARAAAVVKCVSRHGLCIPLYLEGAILQYIGSDVYYVRLHFEHGTSRSDMFDEISCRHPRIGLRHCWVKPGIDRCGQRTLVNGEETDEPSFNRHINATHYEHWR